MIDKSKLLEKPIFFKGIINVSVVVLGIVFGIAPSFIPSITEQRIFNIPLNWLLLSSTIIICTLIYTGIYTFRVNKFYKNYTEQYDFISSNRNALSEDIKLLKQNNKYLCKKYGSALRIIETLEETLDSASREPNKYDEKLINSLLKNVILHKELLERGDDFNGE